MILAGDPSGEPHGRESGPVCVGPGPSPSELRRGKAQRGGRDASPLEATPGARPGS